MQKANQFFSQNLSENRLSFSLLVAASSAFWIPQRGFYFNQGGCFYNFSLNSEGCSQPHPPTHSRAHTAAENESSVWMPDCLICNVIPCLTVTGWQTGIGSIIQNYLLCIPPTTKPNTLTLPNMVMRLVCSRCFGSSGTASKSPCFSFLFNPTLNIAPVKQRH